MGERLRAFDWSRHPLGPPAHWPGALRMAVSLCLNSSFPTAVYWGPDFHVLYNDAWSVIPGERHPAMLGMPAREGWSDIWHVVGPQFERVFRSGVGEALYGEMLPMVRGGRPTETWWNYSLTPIRHSDNSIGGIFNQGNEITEIVQARRQREAEIGRWRQVFQQAPAGIALLRGPEHRFELTNDAYRALIGGRDVIGQRVVEALPEIAGQGFEALLDQVFTTGQPHLGTGAAVRLRRRPDGPVEDCVLDFIYQPTRGPDGTIEGIFVLVLDVTERARAESALRVTNWQLGEERARLAALIDAEQRAREALRRMNANLEGHVATRTRELSTALGREQEIAARMRATFQTPLLYQGFLDPAGTVLDANATALAGAGCRLHEVVGRPLWDTPWFSTTPGMPDVIRDAVRRVQAGESVHARLQLRLPHGERTFAFWLRPALDERRQMIGMVPEGLDITEGLPAA